MSGAIHGHGTLLQIGDGASPENFTTIAEVTDINGPNISVDTVDVTSHSSPGAYKEYIVSLIEPGEVRFTVNFIPTDATHGLTSGLLKDLQDRTLRNFQLVFPDATSTTYAFSAYVTGFQIKEPTTDVLGADVTLKITGQITAV